MAKGDSEKKGTTKKSRRVKGEGGLFQRDSDGKWVGRFVAGRDEETGQPVRKTVYGATRAEAKKKLDALRDKYDGASFIEADKITVKEWLAKWLELYATPPKVELTTHEWYDRLIRLYLNPYLGPIKLCRLQGLAIQQMLVDMTKAPPAPELKEGEAARTKKRGTCQKGETVPGPKSARTIKAVYAVLAMALTVAAKQGLIKRSPAETVSPPTVTRKEKKPLTTKEWDALLHAAQDTPDMFTAIVLEWATGMRRSELLALRWEDVDLTARRITIRQAIKICSKDNGGITTGSPKTQASLRILDLTPSTGSVLKAHKKAQAAQQLSLAGKWPRTGLVFVTSTGTMWDPRNWSKRFKTIAKAAGIDISVHTLRHDMSSRLAAQNIPIKEAQYQLGHTTVTMLLDTYAHRLQGGQSKVTKAILKTEPKILKNTPKPGGK